MEFLDKARIKGQELLEDARSYMVQKFNQSLEMFSYGSSYGQILLVLKNLTKINLFYNQDVAVQSNFLTANRKSTVYSNARLSGHNPTRGSSAIGEITIKLKAGKEKSLQSPYIYIPNYLKLRCINNGLEYIITLPQDNAIVDIREQNRFIIRQGKIESQTFTGTGTNLQSLSVVAPVQQQIDNEFVIVTINNNVVNKISAFSDATFGQYNCIVTTSFGMGVDIFFYDRTGEYVPKLGEIIRVDYLLTDGSIGNIFRDAEFTFVDTGFDNTGAELDLNQLFDIIITEEPKFGSDGENPDLTKILSTTYPRYQILHDEKSIRYYFERMNYFSNVIIQKNIEEFINTFTVYLYPDIKQRLYANEDYFNLDIRKLLLTTTESVRLLRSIEESGYKSANIDIKIKTPNIRKFAYIIIVDAFEKSNGFFTKLSDLKRKIRNVLSEYHLKNKRVNIIPNSDIVRIIDEIPEVDKVKVIFVPQDKAMVNSLGDIVIPDTDIAVARGGFKDESGVDYIDEFAPDSGVMGNVNIQVKFVK